MAHRRTTPSRRWLAARPSPCPYQAPSRPFRADLTATLQMEGYRAARSTACDCGTARPDLRPGAAAVAAEGRVSRALTALASSEGLRTALSTTARFTDRDPAKRGVLIGTADTPGLDAGDQAVASLVWDIRGKGGEHTLVVVVESVGEFDEGKDAAEAAVILPRLDSTLVVEPRSITAGVTVMLGVQLRNLQGATALPVKATVEVRSPAGTAVYGRT